MFFDPLYLLFAIPGLIVAGLASFYVQSTFSEYSRFRASSGLNGAQAAAQMLHRAGIYEVRIERVDGFLSDHYDPSVRVLRLSPGVYDSDSLSAIGVACHEAGHALQDAAGYAPLGLRSALVPITNISSWLSFLQGIPRKTWRYTGVFPIYSVHKLNQAKGTYREEIVIK